MDTQLEFQFVEDIDAREELSRREIVAEWIESLDKITGGIDTVEELTEKRRNNEEFRHS